MVDFSVTKTVAILGLTTYTLGLAIGPILTAPLSEGHGRRIVYFVTAPIFMLFILGAGFSKSYASLCVRWSRWESGLSGRWWQQR
jgi:MFS family permease